MDDIEFDEVDEVDPRVEYMTAARTTAFTAGLALLAKYQRELPADYNLLNFEDVDFGRDNGPDHELAGMMGLFAIAGLPERVDVSAGDAAALESLGWFNGGTWHYLLVRYPKI